MCFSRTGSASDLVDIDRSCTLGGSISNSVSCVDPADEHFKYFNVNGTREKGTILHGVCDHMNRFDISVGIYLRHVAHTAHVDVQKDTVRWLSKDWKTFCSTELRYSESGFARDSHTKLRQGVKLNKRHYYRLMRETWIQDYKEWVHHIKAHVYESLQSDAWKSVML